MRRSTARAYLSIYPQRIAELIANSSTAQEEIFDGSIRISVHVLFRSALAIYPKRMAAAQGYGTCSVCRREQVGKRHEHAGE